MTSTHLTDPSPLGDRPIHLSHTSLEDFLYRIPVNVQPLFRDLLDDTITTRRLARDRPMLKVVRVDKSVLGVSDQMDRLRGVFEEVNNGFDHRFQLFRSSLDSDRYRSSQNCQFSIQTTKANRHKAP